MAEALRELGERPALREDFVKHSALIVHAFPWDAVAQRYESIYFDIVRQRPQA
jgi:glycosyltransferase involved in cell wall biosynthesis